MFCLGADARDVSIQGGQYPLHHAVLAEFPLGVSNHFVGPPSRCRCGTAACS
ncbi:MAG: hypothetical protein V8S97_06380 [Oscillospiraceae bacterium]